MAQTHTASSPPEKVRRWGHADLTGNMWELVFDFYEEAWLANRVCQGCINLGPTLHRTRRGGCWEYQPTDERIDAFAPHMYIGFRCARDISRKRR